MRPVIPPFALVAIAVRVRMDAAAGPLVAPPLTLVTFAVGRGVEPFAVPFSAAHLPHVLGEDAVVEPLHGAAAGRAAVGAAGSAPCYNFPWRVSLIPDPATRAGVDGPAGTILSGQRVGRRGGRSRLSVESTRKRDEKGHEKNEGAHRMMVPAVDSISSVRERPSIRERFRRAAPARPPRGRWWPWMVVGCACLFPVQA